MKTNPDHKIDLRGMDIDGCMNHGLTKREYFALKAMHAVEASNIPASGVTLLTCTGVALRAVKIADNLIKILNGEGPVDGQKWPGSP